MTGVQRYAMEMIRALDGLISAGEVPSALASKRWTLLKPAPARHDLLLQAIETQAVNFSVHPQVWDQALLPWVARNGVLLSLANSGPVLHGHHLVVIHDAIVFRHPEFYGRGYVWFHRTMGRLLAKTATIGTVSAFSQHELADIFGKSPASIPVFANGADHLARVTPDDTVLDELDLRGRPFFLAVGSINGNKNVRLAAQAFARLNRPDARLVVVGSRGAIFRSISVEAAPGLVQPGRLPDERLASLYAHASAFVFPSFYEGFGIPPLEAMAFGSPVIASTADAVRETCGDAASYFPPDDAGCLASLLAARLDAGPYSIERRKIQKERAAKFTWEASARRLLEAIPSL
jgi:glycosyltransferase involved in cell wall biosynthesis